jgi:hypothetical protein
VVVDLPTVPKVEHAKCQTHNYDKHNNFGVFFLQHNSTTSREVIEKKITSIGRSAVKLYLPESPQIYRKFTSLF